MLSGILISLLIFFLSFFTTEINNRFIIRRIPNFLRVPFSLMLAYISGTLGGYLGYEASKMAGLLNISLKHHQLLVSLNILGILTASVGFLIYLIVISKREWEQLKVRLLTQELKNLELQINPHFLFNTINAIAELVHLYPEEAEKALINFSRFLRKVLYSDLLIPLKDELENIQEYWSIVKLRTRDSIDLQVYVQEDLDLSLKVPKFCLQMLIENALKHGLRWKRGKIQVLITQKGDKLVMEVRDNGVGFSKLREGMGLKNVKDRLALIGGKLSYGREGDYTVFRIEIDHPTSIQNRFSRSNP